ncbi:MAG TPA: prenyltransferase/squalene oxidase repeat-containing protein, partial [Pirellulales bacterium]|nr:prenyltransferase/squalene oxidase repeat-containing protein [Pirellulales bacterium]
AFPGQHGTTTAVPALAGMAFLSAGYTPGLGPYGKHINRCVDYVLEYEQKDGAGKPNGYLVRTGADKMYAHCIATLFLSEVSGMVDPQRQQKIDEALSRALLLILKAQQINKAPPHAGGWRYEPTSTDSDLSLTGWAIMALRSARLNGAPVPDEAIANAVKYVYKNHEPNSGGFGYSGPQPNVAMTGVGLLCLSLSGQHASEALPAAGNYILKHSNGNLGGHPEYAEYYCSQAMFQLGGDKWVAWAEQMYPRIISKQSANGSWSNAGYNTAMLILSMTVSYRQLPVYQR